MLRISSRRPGRVLAVFSAFALLLLAPMSAVPASSSVSGAGARAATPHTWRVMVGGESSSGAVQGMAYGPKAIWINVGDTVHWVAAAREPHTVSFINSAHPATPFNPATKYMVTRTTKTWISKPGQFRNSGILTPLPDPVFPTVYKSYDLKFLGVGDYNYLCYLHGQAMKGVVHVRKAGTAYPATQAQYDLRATKARLGMIEHGLNLWGKALGAANSQHVFAGASDMTAMVMRFIPGSIVVRVGDSVTFDMARNGIPVPHTVTFGQPPANPFQPVGDPTNFTGGDLSSGALWPAAFAPPGSQSTFTVTFNSTGTYSWICMFHDGMGMHGQVVVQP
jgi:plastocyanin